MIPISQMGTLRPRGLPVPHLKSVERVPSACQVGDQLISELCPPGFGALSMMVALGRGVHTEVTAAPQDKGALFLQLLPKPRNSIQAWGRAGHSLVPPHWL